MKKLFFVCLVVLVSGLVSAEISYNVIDLGDLGGDYTYAESINEHGQITGSSTNADGTYRAFIYSNGVMTDLGTLGNYNSSGNGINDNGQVAGIYRISPGWVGTDVRGFVYENGTITTLNTLGGPSGYCFDINNSGQATGTASTATGEYPVIYNSNGSITNLGGFGYGGYGNGVAINEQGYVTGAASGSYTNHFDHAFLYKNGVKTDLGTLGGDVSYGRDINEDGIVVGSSTYQEGLFQYNAFVYDDDVMTDLGTLGGIGSTAYGINDLGQITGSARTSSNIPHAFIYEDGVMLDLNTLFDPASGWLLRSGTGINNLGQICGTGLNPQGEQHAFLLTPIPEPTTLLLLGLGGVLLRKRS
jgi:probable HAF family extracellular repeat protein